MGAVNFFVKKKINFLFLSSENAKRENIYPTYEVNICDEIS